MPARNARRRSAATAVASFERWHGPNDPRTIAARRDLAAERVADTIELYAGTLTQQQRTRLAAMLLVTPTANGGDA